MADEKKTRQPVEYLLGIPMPRAAVIEAFRGGFRGVYVAVGDLTDENLNYMSELAASEGWHQNSVMGLKNRAAVMRITNDNDTKE